MGKNILSGWCPETVQSGLLSTAQSTIEYVGVPLEGADPVHFIATHVGDGSWEWDIAENGTTMMDTGSGEFKHAIKALADFVALPERDRKRLYDSAKQIAE